MTMTGREAERLRLFFANVEHSGGIMGCYPAAASSHLEHGSLRFPQLVKRRLSGRHLDDGATQRPDVRRLAVPSGTFVDDFRSHVLQRACTNRRNPLHTGQPIIPKNAEKHIYFD